MKPLKQFFARALERYRCYKECYEAGARYHHVINVAIQTKSPRLGYSVLINAYYEQFFKTVKQYTTLIDNMTALEQIVFGRSALANLGRLHELFDQSSDSLKILKTHWGENHDGH